MVHVVFQEADIGALQKGIDLDASLTGTVLHIKDDFAVGPLTEIFTDEGRERRRQWWREVLSGGDYDGLVDHGNVNDVKSANELTSGLDADPGEKVWIWAAQNKHDVSGYYWLISQLKEYQGRILILYLNNLPFINEKGNIFYPENLFQIAPKEFLKAKRLARVVTMSEFEVDTDEWTRLCDEGKEVRLLEGGKKLVQYGNDFYDEHLIKFITGDWIKVNRLIQSFLHKSVHKTGDAYLLWRIKKMVKEGKLEAQGELRNMRDFEVKVKLAMPELHTL